MLRLAACVGGGGWQPARHLQLVGMMSQPVVDGRDRMAAMKPGALHLASPLGMVLVQRSSYGIEASFSTWNALANAGM